MQIICISGSESNRIKALTACLARKLDYESIRREELVEEGIKEGIQVGKLETATIKPQIFTERLALQREFFRAFAIGFLTGRSAKNGIVYHGRSGHLLFTGIDHVLKVRIVEDESTLIKDVMQRLGIDSKKAIRYVKDVEAGRNKWARSMHGVSLEDTAYYDVVLNLGHMSVENAAAALASIAQLPDFQVTPASKRSMDDLGLAANARVLLARDDRTFQANVKVRANRGVVTVTYLPQDAGISKIIPEVLTSLPAMRELSVTMATTNILWIEETFKTDSEAFQQVAAIATKWNAAIDLLQFVPRDSNGQEEWLSSPEPESLPQRPHFAWKSTGGIEDEEDVSYEDKDFQDAKKSLARLGCFGGGRKVVGSEMQVAKSIDWTVPYSLVVVGSLFLSKTHATQTRMTRQLQTYLSDQIKAPIVNTEELKSQYLFGRNDLLNMVGCLGLFSLILFLAFTHQVPILKFLSGIDSKDKIIAVMAVLLFIPTIAYLYGNAVRSFMKLIRME